MAEPSRESRLDAAIAAYYQACEAGSPPDREAFLVQHPDLRTELESFLDDKAAFERRAGTVPTADETATVPPRNPGTPAPVSPRTIRYFGDYELLEEIARGGMGVVFKARQVSLNRIVAVKMILAGNFATPADVQRFRAEAESAANLDHPNILPIYEVGEHEGQHYFSMKLVEGGNLAGVTSQGSSVGIRDQVEILVQVARAVHFAHQRGIIHRDLKPANILLDANGTPYVSDFGLAKRIERDSSLTQSGAIVGTPAYMAPEQARAEKQLSTAVDVYSLGAILYQMLTGKPPFAGTTPVDTMIAVLEREPEWPTNCDKDLATIAMKCLEKEPGKRYGSAEALAAELERWRKGEPIDAKEAGLIIRFTKWTQRNPLATAWLSALPVFVFADPTSGLVAGVAASAILVPLRGHRWLVLSSALLGLLLAVFASRAFAPEWAALNRTLNKNRSERTEMGFDQWLIPALVGTVGSAMLSVVCASLYFQSKSWSKRARRILAILATLVVFGAIANVANSWSRSQNLNVGIERLFPSGNSTIHEKTSVGSLFVEFLITKVGFFVAAIWFLIPTVGVGLLLGKLASRRATDHSDSAGAAMCRGMIGLGIGITLAHLLYEFVLFRAHPLAALAVAFRYPSPFPYLMTASIDALGGLLVGATAINYKSRVW